jgi:adenylate kinase
LATQKFKEHLAKHKSKLIYDDTGAWINSSYPFLVGHPDAILKNESGDVVATVEYKSYSCNNYPGTRYLH